MIHSVKRLGEINKQGSDRATLIQCTAPVPSHLVNIPVRPSFSYIVSPYTCGQLWRPRAGCHRWQQPGRRRAVQITVGEFFAIFHPAIHPPCMYTLCICGVFLEINFIVMHSLHCFHLVRPDVCPVPSARPLSVPASPLLCNNGIVRGTDKSIINICCCRPLRAGESTDQGTFSSSSLNQRRFPLWFLSLSFAERPEVIQQRTLVIELRKTAAALT